MKALILCGGLATRLGETARDLPKLLLPVGGRAFIEVLFEQLREAKLKRIVLATGHLHEHIAEHVGDGERFGLRVQYSREKEPLGTAGAIVHALDLLDDRFLAMNGDSFLDVELREFVDFARGADAPAMALTRVSDRGRYGTVDVAGDLVTGFHEKAERSGGLINAGIYALRKDDFADVPHGEAVSIEKDLFPRWCGRLRAFVTDGYFVDIGTPESYAAVKEGFHGDR